MKRRLWCRLAAGAAFVLASAGLRADERILDFHSDIVVQADAGMQVEETIRVHAEGDKIRHGIYRDFPTDYRDAGGNRIRVDFEPLDVTRDGTTEPWHSERQGNGVRVYFGTENTRVPPGDHTYRLRYRTTRQLGFFDDHNELYWNVTGSGWDFPIDKASAAVTLPDSIAADALHAEAYTGAQGVQGAAYRARSDAPSHVVFETTSPLGAHEGLTIVVTFPKGIVAEPTLGQRAHWFLHDNAGVLVGIGGLGVLLAYYLWQWLRVGRDPKPGVIIPQYEAPGGLSPGSLRHIERMRYDNRCFAADVVDLAVRGALDIHQDGSSWTLQRGKGARGGMPGVEATLLRDTLGSRRELELEKSQHAVIGAALKNHEKALKAGNVPRYFSTNSALVIPGAILCLIALLAGLFAQGSGGAVAGGAFMLVWLSGWSAGTAALAAGAINAWRQPATVFGIVGALFATLFALPFLFGELAGIGMFFMITGVGFGLVAAALVAINVAFFQWLKAPSPEGRKILDHIAGLRLYLGVAERDELARQKAPPMTFEEFQKFLPYALALGVEKTWTDRFAAAVGPAAAAAAASTMAWYHSSSGIGSLSNLSSGLGSSLSGAISSSSTAPGSSSGSSGGGSSGGGGGGGGGGGW